MTIRRSPPCYTETAHKAARLEQSCRQEMMASSWKGRELCRWMGIREALFISSFLLLFSQVPPSLTCSFTSGFQILNSLSQSLNLGPVFLSHIDIIDRMSNNESPHLPSSGTFASEPYLRMPPLYPVLSEIFLCSTAYPPTVFIAQ